MRARLCAQIAVLSALVACVVTTGDAVTASAAGARLQLHAPRINATSVVLKGRAPAKAQVRLQVRRSAGWRRVASDRASRFGRFTFRRAIPAEPLRYRVVTRRTASAARVVEPPVVEQPVVEQPVVEPPVEEAPAVAQPKDACGVQPRKQNGSHWSCTFVDEFDDPTLDKAKWLVQETWYSAMTSGNNDCYVNDPSTIALESGKLLLTSHIRTEPFTCKSPTGAFTTTSTAATVATRDRFTQTYGRFAFRAKFPDTAGISGPHSALWLYPQKHTYGRWPHSGEIDVAEWFSSRPDNMYPSVHYEGENPMLSTGYNCPMPTAGTAYHTYALEWTPTIMRFYYDDKLCFEHSWTPSAPLTAPQPFDQPFYVVLTQVWGNHWNAVTADTPDSATLSVDWVRAWE